MDFNFKLSVERSHVRKFKRLLSSINCFFFLFRPPQPRRSKTKKKIPESPVEDRRSKTEKNKSEKIPAAGFGFALPASQNAIFQKSFNWNRQNLDAINFLIVFSLSFSFHFPLVSFRFFFSIRVQFLHYLFLFACEGKRTLPIFDFDFDFVGPFLVRNGAGDSFGERRLQAHFTRKWKRGKEQHSRALRRWRIC